MGHQKWDTFCNGLAGLAHHPVELIIKNGTGKKVDPTSPRHHFRSAGLLRFGREAFVCCLVVVGGNVLRGINMFD